MLGPNAVLWSYVSSLYSCIPSWILVVILSGDVYSLEVVHKSGGE